MGRFITRAARFLAWAGGALLALLSIMVVCSIIGRALDGIAFFGPIRGDYELVEMGTAIAVFAFLPWCQLNRGHVSVDILTNQFPVRLQDFFVLVGEILIAACALILARQLWFGFGEKFPYGSDAMRATLGMGSRPFFPETSYELSIPAWVPYGLSVIGALLFFLVALYTVWRSLNELIRGAAPIHGSEEI
ncbi:TRAP transporter small permease subunit [Rhodobacterales bacterium HKCCE3408]|nr:TRAP transporter small permease subunit [Rhodobacterales bacterium HKCCE3408]